MNYKEIVVGDNEKVLKETIKEIHRKAISLDKENIICTRFELVEYLNEKIPNLNLNDSSFINNLVEEAYKRASNSKRVQNAIINNIKANFGNNSVYNPNRVRTEPISFSFIDNESIPDIVNDIVHINQRLDYLSESTGQTDEILEKAENLLELKPNLTKWSISGNTKVEQMVTFVKEINFQYRDIINIYLNVKNEGLDLISDFEYLRDKLKVIREDIVEHLVDLLGTSVKTSNPDLFDFSEIEWKDFEESWEKLDLHFDDVESQSNYFKMVNNEKINNIELSARNNFSRATKKSGKLLRKKNVKEEEIIGEFVGAGINFAIDGIKNVMESRNFANETIAKLEQDLENLKSELREDKESILLDLLRIGELQIKLREKLVPSLSEFINKLIPFLKGEIKNQFEELYKAGNISELKNENSKIKLERRKIEFELNDIEDSYKVISSRINDAQEYIVATKNEIDMAISLKPKAPSNLINVFSFGISINRFKKLMRLWENLYSQDIKNFNDVIAYKNENEENLKKVSSTKLSLKERFVEIEDKLKENSELIRSQVNTDEKTKAVIKDLMLKIKDITQASKNILETEIDDTLKITY